VRAKVCTEEPLHLAFVLQRATPAFPAIHAWAAWHSAFARLPAPQRAVAAMVGVEERCRPGLWHAQAMLPSRLAARSGLVGLPDDSDLNKVSLLLQPKPRARCCMLVDAVSCL